MTLISDDAPVEFAPARRRRRTPDPERQPDSAWTARPVPPAPPISTEPADVVQPREPARPRPTPHSRGRSRAYRIKVFLRAHGPDVGLLLLAALCAVLLALCLTT